MNNNYSTHRLASHEALRPYYNSKINTKSGSIPFWDYAGLLYNQIVLMVPGESLKIDDMVAEDNRDVFIKTLCAFILTGVAQGFYFNETYTEFRRASSPIKQTEENILKQIRI